MFQGTGPVTYKTAAQKNEFVKAIDALYPHGGGDCPEKTFQGIKDAILENSNYGCPLYVFTDATALAKDKVQHFEDIKALAGGQDVSINFFTTGLCGRSSYKPFEELARETGGQFLKLLNAHELKKLSSSVGVTLGGTTVLAKGGSNSASGKKRRSPRSSSYDIPIDDSAEKIIVSVTTEKMGPSINLRNPRGALVNSGKITFSKGAIYEIPNPRPGTWKLTVSAGGKHTYLVKGSSKTNVDFEYFFVMFPTRGRSRMPIPISHPLQG